MLNNILPYCCSTVLVTNATCAEVEMLMSASVAAVNAANTEHCKSPRATPCWASEIIITYRSRFTRVLMAYRPSRLWVYHKSIGVAFRNLFQAVRPTATDVLENPLHRERLYSTNGRPYRSNPNWPHCEWT